MAAGLRGWGHALEHRERTGEAQLIEVARPALDALVEKSLVQVERLDPVRYRLLDVDFDER